MGKKRKKLPKALLVLALCVTCVFSFGGCSSIILGQLVGALEGSGSKTDANKNENGTATTDESFLEKKNYIQSLVDYYLWQETDEEALYDGMYKGMMEALGDPYSCYYTKEEYAQLMESVEGVYCGIGALVSQNATTKVITIVRPFVNGPAYNAGMLPGDILTEIDGEDISTWDINLAVKHMKGEQGTQVSLKVWRPSESRYIEMTVTRDLIEVETVSYQMLEDEIGYIYVMEFDDITTQQFETAYKNLLAQGMKGLVIDIRDNPGGLLTTVSDMLDLFLDKGTIVYTIDKYEHKEVISAKKGKVDLVPMTVIVNGNSASASEIFSGALQDYGLATILGTQSFGKGIVQSIIPLSDGSAVKMTVSRYFTPNGVCIHGTGITPDVVVELDEELRTKVVVPLEEDNQVQAAIKNVKSKMK